MAFLTDLTEQDVVILECNHTNCNLSKLKITLKITKKVGGNKVRLSIDADKDIRINKIKTKAAKRGKNDDRR
jgi:hypothetical protein